MKRKKWIALVLAAAVGAALLAGCGSTAQTEAAAPAEESMEPEYLFDKGVWSGSIDGKIDVYFIFYDQTSGRFERADGTGGVPFTCEQHGTEALFHFGSDDDETRATFSLGDNTGTFEFEAGTQVYFIEALTEADADTFEVPAQQPE